MKFFNPKVIYQTPDGENCLEKTFESTKLFTVGGLWLSSLEMFAMRRPTTISGIATRATMITLPAVGIGATYASVSCLLGSLRNKDDEINHLLAGALAGSIVGMKSGKPLVLLSGAIVGGLVGYFPKYFLSRGHDLMRWNKPIAKEMAFSWNHDKKAYFCERTKVKEPTNY